MHFLDVVFYQQFPMYKPNMVEGGRGWLMIALLRSRPLFHAALALSSYHRDLIVNTKSSDRAYTTCTVEHQEHFAKSLFEFHKAIRIVSQYVLVHMSEVELATYLSMVQLIYFEVCVQVHANVFD